MPPRHDMSRPKILLIAVRIEERESLMAMDYIDRVVDIECHRTRWPEIATHKSRKSFAANDILLISLLCATNTAKLVVDSRLATSPQLPL
jgi:hypothetical protein